MSLLIVRLVVFVLLFWAGFRIWQYWQTVQNQSQKNPADNQPNKNQDDSENMVPCAECGVHLPQSTAIKDGEHFFCSSEHQAAFKNKKD